MLQEFSDDELRAEIERRTQSKREAPLPFDDPNWKPLLDVCHDYLHKLETLGYANDDYPHYIFEAALTAIYGGDIWAFVNSVKG